MPIYPGVTPLDVAGSLEAFSFANSLCNEKIYDVIPEGPTAGPVTTRAGIGFLPSCAKTELALPVEKRMVAGGGKPRTWTTQEMTGWLRAAATQAGRFASICTGAFLLGAAGLLDGRRVATHWASCADLARFHPTASVEVDPIALRVRRFFGSSGITAGTTARCRRSRKIMGGISHRTSHGIWCCASSGQAQSSVRMRASLPVRGGSLAERRTAGGAGTIVRAVSGVARSGCSVRGDTGPRHTRPRGVDVQHRASPKQELPLSAKSECPRSAGGAYATPQVAHRM